MFAVLAGWKAALLMLGVVFVLVGVPVGIGLAIGIPLRRRLRGALDRARIARAAGQPDLYERNIGFVCRCIGGLVAFSCAMMLLISVYDPLATAAEHKQQFVTYWPSVHIFFPAVVLFGLLFLLRGRHARAIFLRLQRPDVALRVLLLGSVGISLGILLHLWFDDRLASYGYKPLSGVPGYVLATLYVLSMLIVWRRALCKRPKSDDTP